jgi:hypothetical protein
MQPLEPQGSQRSVLPAGYDASRSHSRSQSPAGTDAPHHSRSHPPAADSSRLPAGRNEETLLTGIRAGDSLVRDIIISLLLFLLLIEWLRPLPAMADVSEIYSIQPFLVVFALCMAIDCFKVPYSWGWIAKSMMVLLFVGFMFERDTFLSGTWVFDLVRLISLDVVHIFQVQLDLISGQTRTLLFLFGWSLLISVVQALMLQRQHSLWFVGATLTYLVCLQLALGTDTVQGIIRTLGYGLILLSLLNLSRIQQTYGFNTVRSGGAFRWLLVSLVVVGVLTGASWYSAVQTAPTPLMKPVSMAYLTDRMFELYNEDTSLKGVAAKSGYGQDDSMLGGPLQSDSSIVFTAKTSELTYWRGESKNFYDGKGWTQTEKNGEPFAQRSPQTSDRAVTQEVLWSSKSLGKQLFYGGTLLQVNALLTEKGEPLSPDIIIANRTNDKVTLPEISDPLSFYKVTVQPVREDPAVLGVDSDSYPASITDVYLQLPANLPRTVRGLAEQVTENRTTPYAKAVAIEQYLRGNYAYSLDKPTRPTRNEDFISHFLFVDRTGYCDHFSTSMVVMLRSVGVPARWVKGYAPGTRQASSEDHLQEVIVRNQDAHSWVEVYFPSTGWISFEPTPGFSALSADHASSIMANAQAERPAMTASLLAIPSVKSLSAAPLEWLQISTNELVVFVQTYRELLVIIASVCLFLLGLFLILWRKGLLYSVPRLFPGYKGRLSSSRPVVRYMDRLWLQLFHKYGAKSSHQTVREYVTALHLGSAVQKQALLEFVLMYETIRYDTPSRPAYSKREITAVWEAIQKTRDTQK